MAEHSQDMSRLRHTCALGLPASVLMPRILAELRRLVPADRMYFMCSDRLGSVANGYFESPEAIALDGSKEAFNRFLDDAGWSFRQTVLFGRRTGNMKTACKASLRFTPGDFTLLEGSGPSDLLDGVISDAYGPLGLVFLLRLHGSPDFCEADEACLRQALPYLAHASCHQGSSTDVLVETEASAVLIFDKRGELTFRSNKATDLCVYALDALEHGIPRESDGDFVKAQSAIGRLFLDAKTLLERHTKNDAPPAWSVSNRWGEFRLRAYELRGADKADVAYGVLLEQMVPLEALVLERIKGMPLSLKQKEVCFLLTRGLKNKEIAVMLSIAQTTLKDHARALYRKLGVTNKEELLRLVKRRRRDKDVKIA